MKISVAIITCKRPAALARLLQGLEALDFDPIEIVVVDNDPLQSAASVLSSHTSRHKLVAVHESTPGIPYARNTALRHCASNADYIAFLDDDEVPAANWLKQLTSAMLVTNADAVGGPVEPVFPVDCPRWIIKGGLFKRQNWPQYQPRSVLITNNCLINATRWRQQPVWFDARLQYTGSSDTLFFWQTRKAGWQLAWASDAMVSEYIQPRRLNTRWLIQRSFRIGNGLSLCAIFSDGWFKAAPIRLIKSLGHLVLGLLALIRLPVDGYAAVVKSAASIARGAGGLCGLLGYRYQEYAPARLIGEPT